MIIKTLDKQSWNAAKVREVKPHHLKGFIVCFSSLAADSYEWGSQSSGINAYIGGDDSYHPPAPPEELCHY